MLTVCDLLLVLFVCVLCRLRMLFSCCVEMVLIRVLSYVERVEL
jgi:hypothetical protein